MSEEVCRNCKWCEFPPKNQWPDACIGACTNPKNVALGPGGWNAGTTYVSVTDRTSCSNYASKTST